MSPCLGGQAAINLYAGFLIPGDDCGGYIKKHKAKKLIRKILDSKKLYFGRVKARFWADRFLARGDIFRKWKTYTFQMVVIGIEIGLTGIEKAICPSTILGLVR